MLCLLAKGRRANIHHHIHHSPPSTQHAVGSGQSHEKGQEEEKKFRNPKYLLPIFQKIEIQLNPKNKEKPPKRRVRPDLNLSDYPRLKKEERKNRDILIK
jgi:hypothetical protein